MNDTSGTRHSGATISRFRLKADRMWNSSLMMGGHEILASRNTAMTWKKSMPMDVTRMSKFFLFR